MKVEISNICKNYNKVPVLKNLNFTIEPGKIIGLLGPNGSGKTTLIKIMNGLIQPTSGDILFDGQKPGVYSKSQVAYLPDKSCLDEQSTPRQLIRFFKDFYADFDEEKCLQLLKNLDLPLDKRLKHLSKGTREKVQLTMVMSRNAKLYLLDEPIGGVDPLARDYILETIIQSYNKEASVLISTHLIRDIENVLDDIIMIQDGEIRMHDTADQLRNRYNLSLDEIFKEVMRS